MWRRLVLVAWIVLLSGALAGQNQCECGNQDELNTSFSPFFKNSDLAAGQSFWAKMPATGGKACRLFIGLQLVNIAYNQRDTLVMRSVLSELNTLTDSACSAQHSNLLWRWSQFYRITEKYDSAMTFGQRALAAAVSGKHSNIEVAVLTNLAQIMLEINDPRRAVIYQRKCAMLSLELKHPNTAIVLGNLAGIYGGLFDATGDTIYFDSLFDALNQSNRFIRENDVTREQLSYNYANMGQASMLLERYEVGLLYCDSALRSPGTIDGSRVTAYNTKCQIYAALKDGTNALKYADSANDVAHRSQDTRTQVLTMTSLYEVYKMNGNYTLALAVFEKLVQVRDSINKSDRIAAIIEVEEKYNKARNEKTINELHQNQQIDSLNIQLLTAGVIGALLVIVLVIVLFRQNVLRSNQVRLVTEQRLNRARMNPHFFFNTLSALQTSALKEKDPLKIADLLSKYSRIMRSTLESTYEDLVSVEQEVQYLQLYLQLQQFRCNHSFVFAINLDEQIESSEVLLPGMIIQPFVENAIEHGFNGIENGGIIDVSFKIISQNLVVTVSDNGAGAKTAPVMKEHKSRATEITRDRLNLLNNKHKSNASFEIKNNTGDAGTTVVITLPILK